MDQLECPLSSVFVNSSFSFDYGLFSLSLAVIYYSILLSFRVRRLCYKLLFRYPAGRTNRSRSRLYLFTETFDRTLDSLPSPPHPLPNPTSVDGASIFRLSWMVCGPSKIQISPWKYLRLEPSLSPSLHDLSFSRPSPASTLFRHSLHSRLLSLSPIFPSFRLVVSFSFSPGIFFSIPLTLSSPPSRKEGRNWPFGHERPRRKAAGSADSSDRAGKDWGLCGIG